MSERFVNGRKQVERACPYCCEMFWQSEGDRWSDPAPRACSPEHSKRIGDWTRWVRESSRQTIGSVIACGAKSGSLVRYEYKTPAPYPPAGPAVRALVSSYEVGIVSTLAAEVLE